MMKLLTQISSRFELTRLLPVLLCSISLWHVICARYQLPGKAPGRVHVQIYDHRGYHDPVEQYGAGPWKFFGHGYGIDYGYEPDGSHSHERGYGFIKAYAREFCKPGIKYCPTPDPNFWRDANIVNSGVSPVPYFGHPPADVPSEPPNEPQPASKDPPETDGFELPLAPARPEEVEPVEEVDNDPRGLQDALKSYIPPSILRPLEFDGLNDLLDKTPSVPVELSSSLAETPAIPVRDLDYDKAVLEPTKSPGVLYAEGPLYYSTPRPTKPGYYMGPNGYFKTPLPAMATGQILAQLDTGLLNHDYSNALLNSDLNGNLNGNLNSNLYGNYANNLLVSNPINTNYQLPANVNYDQVTNANYGNNIALLNSGQFGSNLLSNTANYVPYQMMGPGLSPGLNPGLSTGLNPGLSPGLITQPNVQNYQYQYLNHQGRNGYWMDGKIDDNALAASNPDLFSNFMFYG